MAQAHHPALTKKEASAKTSRWLPITSCFTALCRGDDPGPAALSLVFVVHPAHGAAPVAAARFHDVDDPEPALPLVAGAMAEPDSADAPRSLDDSGPRP